MYYLGIVLYFLTFFDFQSAVAIIICAQDCAQKLSKNGIVLPYGTRQRQSTISCQSSFLTLSGRCGYENHSVFLYFRYFLRRRRLGFSVAAGVGGGAQPSGGKTPLQLVTSQKRVLSLFFLPNSSPISIFYPYLYTPTNTPAYPLTSVNRG